MCIFLDLEPGKDLFLAIFGDLVVGVEGDVQHIADAACLQDDVSGVTGDDFSLDVIEHIKKGANVRPLWKYRCAHFLSPEGDMGFRSKF